MAFEPAAFNPEQIAAAKNLFAQPCNFVLGVAKLEQLPVDGLPEIAFVGRSNVGKSSLINAVTGQKGLAKTSNTPGRTQQLNYFNLDGKIYLVDLPGYGFAQAPENLVRQWQQLIFAYLQGRVELKRVFMLIDSRHGIKKVDEEIIQNEAAAAVTYQNILTKTEKNSTATWDIVLKPSESADKKHGAAYTAVLTTSSEKKLGIDLLRAEIASLI